MECPVCHGDTKVVDSRDEGDGDYWRRRRRRHCLDCNERFTTYEITAAQYDKVQAMSIDTEQIDAVIATLRNLKVQFDGTSKD